MGYVDKFYYGQAKIVNDTNTSIVVDGKTIEPGGYAMVKGTESYTINGKEIYAGYGDCIRIGD